MKTQIPYSPDIFSQFAPHTSASSFLNALFAWLDRQRQRVYLSELDNRLLKDIGKSRFEALREAQRWT